VDQVLAEMAQLEQDLQQPARQIQAQAEAAVAAQRQIKPEQQEDQVLSF
jgi:outer membrane murein-binding lipoprotein Lpp